MKQPPSQQAGNNRLEVHSESRPRTKMQPTHTPQINPSVPLKLLQESSSLPLPEALSGETNKIYHTAERVFRSAGATLSLSQRYGGQDLRTNSRQ